MITAALEAGIKARRVDGWRVDVHPADATSRPEFLARHVYELLRRALEAIHGDDDAQSALPATATDTDKLTPESLFEARSQRRMLQLLVYPARIARMQTGNLRTGPYEVRWRRAGLRKP